MRSLSMLQRRLDKLAPPPDPVSRFIVEVGEQLYRDRCVDPDHIVAVMTAHPCYQDADAIVGADHAVFDCLLQTKWWANGAPNEDQTIYIGDAKELAAKPQPELSEADQAFLAEVWTAISRTRDPRTRFL